MMMRMISAFILMAGLTAGVAAEKPNVLFIAVDDLNDWVGFLGGHPQAKTPHMDRFAEKAVVFENAHCAAPLCGPSRTALMYGMAPYKSGSYTHADKIYDPSQCIPAEYAPLNLQFQRNGYYTLGRGKVFHKEESRGWDDFITGDRQDGTPLADRW